MLTRLYTLECTQQALVSSMFDISSVLFNYTYCKNKFVMLAKYFVVIVRDDPYHANFMNAVLEKNSCSGS